MPIRYPLAVVLSISVGVTLGFAREACALAGDRYFVTAGSTVTYDDNLYRLPQGLRPPESTGSSARSDLITSFTLRGQADVQVSRQRLRADASVVNSLFTKHDSLDNRGGGVSLNWDWQATSWWSGNAFYSRNRSLSSFADLRTFEKNTTDVTSYGASAEHWLLPDWRAFASLASSRVDNSARSLAAASADNVAYAAGLRWLTGAGSNVRVGLTVTDGRSPNVQVFPGATVDNRFTQTDLGIDVSWRAGGRTDAGARLAYTERRHPQVGARNFTGVTGRLQWDYRWTGKSGVVATARREIGAVTDLVANYVVTEAAVLAPYYLATAKVRVDLNLERQNRTFAGDPGIVINGVGPREDRVAIVGIAVRYQATRSVGANLAYSHARRSSNRDGFDFAANTFSIGVQGTW